MEYFEGRARLKIPAGGSLLHGVSKGGRRHRRRHIAAGVQGHSSAHAPGVQGPRLFRAPGTAPRRHGNAGSAIGGAWSS